MAHIKHGTVCIKNMFKLTKNKSTTTTTAKIAKHVLISVEISWQMKMMMMIMTAQQQWYIFEMANSNLFSIILCRKIEIFFL